MISIFVASLPEIISIDECKGDDGGEKYQTIIADPIKRVPLEIHPDRRKDTLKRYFNKHGYRVKVVVMDMSPSFKAAVYEALDKPVVVVDRFHFSRYIYWALEAVRRKEQKKLHDYDRKRCKQMRHVFYKRNHKLTEKQRWHLNRYLTLSPYLEKVYRLKEAYCLWFDEAKRLGDK